VKASTKITLFLCLIILGAGFLCVWRIARNSSSANYPPSNWDQLRIGMPQAEVPTLLGKPSGKFPPPSVQAWGRPDCSPLEWVLPQIVVLWLFGIDRYCCLTLEQWVYDGGVVDIPQNPVQLPHAFVVYFYEGKVIWFRRPTFGPFVAGDEESNP